MTLNRISLRWTQQRKCEFDIRSDVHAARAWDSALWQPLPYQLFATRPYHSTAATARRDSPRRSLCVRAFPNLLGIRITDSIETEGNCEFCALNAPQGLPRYQVLLFPLWTASELLRIKGRTTSREINHAFDLNWTLTY